MLEAIQKGAALKKVESKDADTQQEAGLINKEKEIAEVLRPKNSLLAAIAKGVALKQASPPAPEESTGKPEETDSRNVKKAEVLSRPPNPLLDALCKGVSLRKPDESAELPSFSPPPPPPLPPFLAKGIPSPPLPPNFMKNGISVPSLLPTVNNPDQASGPSTPFPGLPKPSIKLKPLQWEKLTKSQIVGTLWEALDLETIQKQASECFNLAKIEQLMEAPRSLSAGNGERPLSITAIATDPLAQLRLFPPKDSNNLNITLKGMKLSDDEIVKALEAFDERVFEQQFATSLNDLAKRIKDESINALRKVIKDEPSLAVKLDRPEILYLKVGLP